MGQNINLQQYRNYKRGWKYLVRIIMYVVILVLVLLFMKYKLQKPKIKSQPKAVEVQVIEEN